MGRKKKAVKRRNTNESQVKGSSATKRSKSAHSITSKTIPPQAKVSSSVTLRPRLPGRVFLSKSPNARSKSLDALSSRSKSPDTLTQRSKSPGAVSLRSKSPEPQSASRTTTSVIQPGESILDLVKKSFASTTSKMVGTEFEETRSTNSDSLENDDEDAIYENIQVVMELDDLADDDENDHENDGELEAPVIVWEYERTFANEGEWNVFLENENCWSKLNKVVVKDGIKTVWRCSKVKRRGKQCPSGIYTLHGGEPGNESIILFRKNLDHCHDVNKVKTFPLDDKTQNKIIELYESKCKPKGILYKLAKDENLHQLSINQIKNTIADYKKKKYGNTNITLTQLTDFVKQHLAVPESIDEAFVVAFERSDDDEEPWFRYLVSTKRLLAMAIDAEIIHADSTMKITIQGYPLLAFGTSDKTFPFIWFNAVYK